MNRREPNEGFKLKQLDTSDIEEYNALLRYAFQVTDEELMQSGWENNEITQSKFPVLKHADVIGYFEEDKLASQIVIYPMKANIQGKIMNIGMVTGVSTYPEYMNLGLMSSLIYESLNKMKEQEQTIAFLYPYSIPFYRKKGWEIVSDKMTFRIKDNQLPKSTEVPGRVRRVEEDSPELLALHSRFAKRTHGCLIRDELAWSEYWRWDVDDEQIAIYYNEDEEPMGYLVYLLENDIFHVKEMISLNEEARQGLWGYINAHYSMVDEVVGNNYSNHGIAFLLEDSDITETLKPYIMARIVDFEKFILQYNFSGNIRNTNITFKISDSLLEWNHQCFNLSFNENGVQSLTAKESENSVEGSIGTITAMLMGYKRPTYLKNIERLFASDRTIEILEGGIPNGKAYFSDYI